MDAFNDGHLLGRLSGLGPSIWGWIQQNSSDPFLAAVTATLSIFTLLLVGATLYLAANAIKANRLAEKHHQETLMPAVTFRGRYWPEWRDRTGAHTVSFMYYEGLLQNVGGGPALNVVATLKTQFFGDYTYNIGFLPANYVRDEHRVRQVMDFNLDPVFCMPPHAMQPLDFTLTITYENVFGQSGKTEHAGSVDLLAETYDTVSSMTTTFTRPPIDTQRFRRF